MPDVHSLEQSILERLRSMCPTLSVGVLGADQMRLGEDLAVLESAGVSVAHFDVMDGCFCPALTVGPAYIEAVRTPMLKDVHLLIREPLDWLPEYVAAGADIVTVHLEAAVHIHRVLQRLGALESTHVPGSAIVRGLALLPATPLEWLTEPLLQEIDMIVVLAVNPGWGMSSLTTAALDRLVRVKDVIATSGRDILVCAEGGVGPDNIASVAATGVDLIVPDNSVFAGDKTVENVLALLAAVRD
jgi:ribulose-phosphate 3-epimerase